MKRVSTYIKTLLITASLVAAPLLTAPPAMAVDVFKDGCAGNTGSVCGATQQDDFMKLMKNVVNLLLLILGIIAVIAIIIGGIRYTTSNGDPGQIKSAKDTILYAIIATTRHITA